MITCERAQLQDRIAANHAGLFRGEFFRFRAKRWGTDRIPTLFLAAAEDKLDFTNVGGKLKRWSGGC